LPDADVAAALASVAARSRGRAFHHGTVGTGVTHEVVPQATIDAAIETTIEAIASVAR
jgi:hypothetical protein